MYGDVQGVGRTATCGGRTYGDVRRWFLPRNGIPGRPPGDSRRYGRQASPRVCAPPVLTNNAVEVASLRRPGGVVGPSGVRVENGEPGTPKEATRAEGPRLSMRCTVGTVESNDPNQTTTHLQVVPAPGRARPHLPWSAEERVPRAGAAEAKCVSGFTLKLKRRRPRAYASQGRLPVRRSLTRLTRLRNPSRRCCSGRRHTDTGQPKARRVTHRSAPPRGWNPHPPAPTHAQAPCNTMSDETALAWCVSWARICFSEKGPGPT